MPETKRIFLRCTEWQRGGHAAVVDNRVNYIDLLARYEDTGLTPEEVNNLIKRIEKEKPDK